MDMTDVVCSKCSRPAVMWCSRCHEIYCSSDCQFLDWRDHKLKCFQMPDLTPIRNVRNKHQTNNVSTALHFDTGNNQRRHQYSNNNSRRESMSIEGEMLNSAEILNKPNLPQLDNKDFELKPKQVQSWKIPFAPPKNTFFNVVVQFIEELDPSIVWVTDVKHIDSLNKFISEIERNIGSSSTCNAKDLHIGELVVAPLHGRFLRAEVFNLSKESQHATVRIIDFGNEIRMPFEKLQRSLPMMVNLNAYAIRIRMPSSFSTLQLKSEQTICLPGSKSSDGLYLAELKTNSLPLHLSAAALTNAEIKIQKVFIEGNLALCQLKDVTETNNLDVFLSTEQGIQFDFPSMPIEGTFVAARVKQGWRRSCLLGYWQQENKFLVYLLDEGSIDFSTHIKKIPDAFVSLPMHIFAISSASQQVFFDESQLKSKSKLSLHLLSPESQSNSNDLHYSLNCALFGDGKKICNVFATCFIGLFSGFPIKYWHEHVPDRSSVIITHINNHADVYISATRTLEYVTMFASMAAKCLPFKTDESIAVGEIVFVELEGEPENYFRGEVTKCLNNNLSYEVRNIDTGATVNTIRHFLRKPNNFVRCLPVYLKRVKLLFLETIPNCEAEADSKALDQLEKCVKNATPFTIKFEPNKLNTVDLLFQTKEQQSLSKRLLPQLFEKRKNAATIKTKKSDVRACFTPAVYAEDTPLPLSPPNTPIMFNAPPVSQHLGFPNLNVDQLSAALAAKLNLLEDIETIPLPIGDCVGLFVIDSTSLLTNDFIWAASHNKEIIMNMSEQLNAVSKHCKCPHMEKGYAPRKGEICLAIFEDDGEWYRAVCLQHDKDNKFVVKFIDYGNCSKVARENIMPIAKHLMFPTITNKCLLESVKELNMEQRKNLAKKLANSIITCSVVQTAEDPETYKIKVHDLN